jgi:hypothetical protein
MLIDNSNSIFFVTQTAIFDLRRVINIKGNYDSEQAISFDFEGCTAPAVICRYRILCLRVLNYKNMDIITIAGPVIAHH